MRYPRRRFSPVRRTPGGAALLAALAGPALAAPSPAALPLQPAAPPAEIQPYLGKLADAQTEAQERNVPLVVIVIQEGEEANERYRDGIYRSATLAAGVRDMMVLLVNDGKHATKKIVEKVDGKKVEREVCAEYLTPSCRDHRRNWDPVYSAFNQKGLLTTPNTIITLPDKSVFQRIRDVPAGGPEIVVAAVQDARYKAGPGLSAEQHEAVRQHAAEGRAADRVEDWPRAWRAWQAVLAVTQAGMYADEARAHQVFALEGMEAQLERARGFLKESQVREGYGLLLELADRFEDTPLEDPVKKEIRAAERNKDWRDEIEALKREREAQALLDEIEELVRADKERQAKRELRKLLRKYDGTPAAERARKLYPDWIES